VAFAVFMIIRQINRLTTPKIVETPAETPPPADIILLREIRDLLARKS
jgi:large conductance mechanosensitive channel